jgi:hypothetical protein
MLKTEAAFIHRSKLVHLELVEAISHETVDVFAADVDI